MTITIGIPTRDRPKSLGRLLASLHAQTYRDWDLVIVNDGTGPMLDEHGQMWLDIIKRDHRVDIVRGVRINQAYSHNHVLWHPNSRDRIFRVDDDICLNPNFLERLVQTWTSLTDKDINVGAVGGVYFTEHLRPRVDHPPIPAREHDSTSVARDGTVCAWPYMQKYTDSPPIKCEHLYSSYLYDRDAMRAVGGFPLTYSVGVSYHEETEASYKLHLAGYQLCLVPDATGVHSHENTGGTRLLPSHEHKRRVESDWDMFLRRLTRVRAVNWEPTVALYSDHWSGAGGGQRLTYSVLSALQEIFQSEIPLIYPSHERIQSQDEVRDNFGINVREEPVAYRSTHDWSGVAAVDIVVSIGHSPPSMSEIPPRRHHIHYSLYPLGGRIPPGVDRYVAISGYTSDAVAKTYHRRAEVINPYVPDTGEDTNIIKENSILVVGRILGKGVYDLVTAFLSHPDMPDNSVLNIVVPEEEASSDFRRIERVAESPRVNLHVAITDEELRELYEKSKVLWAARGYKLPEEPAVTNREHFGYTPVEAARHFCLPLAFDGGGYKETVRYRWQDEQTLMAMTSYAIDDKDKWMDMMSDTLAYMPECSWEQFKLGWERVVTSTNSFAWRKDVEMRSAGVAVKVGRSSVDVACIVENPILQTGYGVISQQILSGLSERGFNLHVFAINDLHPSPGNSYASFWPNSKEDHLQNFRSFLSERPYDAAVVAYDPFVSSRFVRGISKLPYRLPVVAFVSQEGLPVSYHWGPIVQHSDSIITYCRAGAEAVSLKHGVDVDYAYLGVDHARFERYSDTDRQALRSMMGWDDQFVVMCVARNARNKRVAAVIKTVSILKHEFGMDDLVLLLHTSFAPDKRFGGIEVEMYSKMMGVEDVVTPSPKPSTGRVEYDTDLSHALGAGQPRTMHKAAVWLRDRVGMIGRYNMADVYLDMSSCEGFNLPLFEAVACGVPAITVNDSFVRTEVREELGLKVNGLRPGHATDQWITGAELHIADPYEAAATINYYRKNADLVREWSDSASRAVREHLVWSRVQEKIAGAVRKCVEG